METQGKKTSLSWCLTDLRRSEKSTVIAGETGSSPRNEVDGWLLHCSSFTLVWDTQEGAGSKFGQM